MNTTTRRYARSLAEAFPDERAGCIEHYTNPLSSLTQGVLGFVAALAAAVAAFLLLSTSAHAGRRDGSLPPPPSPAPIIAQATQP